MPLQALSVGHALFGVSAGTLVVHNAAGECAVRLSNEVRGRLGSLEKGHYLLFAQAAPGDGSGQDAIASLTVSAGGEASLFCERSVPELPRGEHDLIVTHFQGLAPRSAPGRAPSP